MDNCLIVLQPMNEPIGLVEKLQWSGKRPFIEVPEVYDQYLLLTRAEYEGEWDFEGCEEIDVHFAERSIKMEVSKIYRNGRNYVAKITEARQIEVPEELK